MPAKFQTTLALAALLIALVVGGILILDHVGLFKYSRNQVKELETELQAAERASSKAREELTIARSELARIREANRQLESTVDNLERSIDNLTEQAGRDREAISSIERIVTEGEDIIDELIEFFESRAP